MNHTNPNVPAVSSEQISDAYSQAAAHYDMWHSPTVISHGPPSWVAVDNPAAPEHVIRLTYTEDIDYALQEAEHGVNLMRDLRAHRAQIPDFDGDPVAVRTHPGRPVGFVATRSDYLSGNDVTDYEHGQAIASLHNASLEVYTDDLPHVDPLATESHVGKAIEYVKNLPAGEQFRIGDVEMTPEDVQNMEKRYRQAYSLYNDLFTVAEANGTPLVVVQEDVHDGNRLRNKDGVATIFDIRPVVGPPAIDFGRPISDWPVRFGKGQEPTDAFIAGYADTVKGYRLPDEQELELAADFTNLRSALLIASLAINAVRAGHPGEGWMLGEGLHRLRTVDDPDAAWHPLDDARKAAMRANQ